MGVALLCSHYCLSAKCYLHIHQKNLNSKALFIRREKNLFSSWCERMRKNERTKKSKLDSPSTDSFNRDQSSIDWFNERIEKERTLMLLPRQQQKIDCLAHNSKSFILARKSDWLWIKTLPLPPPMNSNLIGLRGMNTKIEHFLSMLSKRMTNGIWCISAIVSCV